MNRNIPMSASRREFLAAAAALPAASQVSAGSATPDFRRHEVGLTVRPFSMTEVRVTAGPFREAQETNRRVLHKLPVDRLVHNFRVNAGLSSSAQPLGGWERPDCEVRGHFTGHFLSALALMHASTGESELGDKAARLVAELAECQRALGNGYLSAFPLEYWDRLRAGKPVWAPFYTLHKIMAGLLDVHERCGNNQALDVLEKMAGWVDAWSAPIPENQMQDILNNEFGGMAEVLYNLAAVTGNDRYAAVACRFEHARIFGPLAGHRDELKGLHANTNVPKIIGAARRYELTGEAEYRDIASFFWYAVTSGRMYCTGGTSNDEHWQTDPGKIAAEWVQFRDTNECCVAYNMLKLTRHLYSWTADPRYFDYYERTLVNHRLGTIDPQTGATMYFLPLRPGGWKTFNSEYDSFWCCTGTGVEEYSKLNDSIYFHDDAGTYVNLFIASELNSPGQGIHIRQETMFPDEGRATLIIERAPPREYAIRVRVPAWTAHGGSLSLNGRPLDVFAEPSSYLTIRRAWKPGDRIEVRFPMALRIETMPDDATLGAILYGPTVMAAEMGGSDLPRYWQDYRLRPQPIMDLPNLKLGGALNKALEQVSGSRFRSTADPELTFAPLHTILDRRYSAYVRIVQA